MHSVLQSIHINPSVLKQSNPKLVAFLQAQGDATSQGTGNKVTDQEACFAEVLEQNGFNFITKKGTSTENYYKYQPNGTQKSPDFEIYDKQLNKTFRFDLKHTKGKTFYLNDGWFEKGTIYVISWSTNKVLIGYGDTIPTEEENLEMEKLIQFKKECNSSDKKTGSLRKYIRFANQYSCEMFTTDFTTHQLNYVLSHFQ